MVGTRVVATPDARKARAAHRGTTIGVGLFRAGSPSLPGLGSNLRLQVIRGLPAPPSQIAWDFLSVAMSIFAADRFVMRDKTADGWTRVISLDVAVSDPDQWKPIAGRYTQAMRFLTGDIWTVTFSAGGAKPPVFQPRFHDRNAVCLFSGGLDSLLGALKLLDEKKRPLLVSQGSPKEVGHQIDLATSIGLKNNRFDGRIHERWRPPYEPSTRCRSLLFIAYGVLAASATGLNEVIIPENGLIAINPPMTVRRLGSLSTRTAHPHFLGEIEGILGAVGLDVRLNNIFEGKSKGEMLAACSHADIGDLASQTYSCGKGKRENGQCGQCVPCLIRRASFNAAGVDDDTGYYADIRKARLNDDVSCLSIAGARRKAQTPAQFARWVAMSGPLPADPTRRKRILRAVSTGLEEVDEFLAGIRWKN